MMRQTTKMSILVSAQSSPMSTRSTGGSSTSSTVDLFPHVADFARSFIHVVSAEADDSRQLRRADLADTRDAIFGFEKGLDKDPGGLLCDAARRRLTVQLDEISGDDHSLVSFDSSRYYPGELPQQRELGSKLLRIIQAVIPDSCEDDEDLNNNNVLYHWDISDANVLVEPATREVTGLLDWEQANTVPLLVPNFFPTIMDLDATLPDMSQLSVYDDRKGNEKDDSRLEREERWDAQCMRATFTARLEELGSPWLAARDNAQPRQATMNEKGDVCSAATTTTATHPQAQLRRLRSSVLRSVMQTTFCS